MSTLTSWITETRETVAIEFGCGVCLDFGYLDGLGPCPHCDPDGYAEHVYYTSQEHRCGLGGADPWPDAGGDAL
ncbi:MAG: hypothetical protein GEV07_05265 [Streptosporangiales bacterium]|nr:hypothetical protein [Streptosporangiales bacterium]